MREEAKTVTTASTSRAASTPKLRERNGVKWCRTKNHFSFQQMRRHHETKWSERSEAFLLLWLFRQRTARCSAEPPTGKEAVCDRSESIHLSTLTRGHFLPPGGGDFLPATLWRRTALLLHIQQSSTTTLCRLRFFGKGGSMFAQKTTSTIG